MLQKLKSFHYLAAVQTLRDVRLLGLLVFAGVTLLVTWSGIGVIQTNYELQKKITALEQEVDLQELENSNLALRNEYFETDQYLELQARRRFNKAAPGETLLIVPRQAALAHSVKVEEAATEKLEAETDKPVYQQHFEAWMEFLFRRNPVKD